MSIKGNWRRHGSEVVIRWCQRFFLVASRLAFAASPLNSVAPNEKKYLWHPGYGSRARIGRLRKHNVPLA